MIEQRLHSQGKVAEQHVLLIPGRIQTGTLNFVSALSGYFQSADGEQFAFSILMNDLKCSNGRAKSLQDRIIREGLKFQRENNGTNNKTSQGKR